MAQVSTRFADTKQAAALRMGFEPIADQRLFCPPKEHAMSDSHPTVSNTVAESLDRIRAAASEQAHIVEARSLLVADARHVERGLLTLIKQALDAGQLDADDAATMLPLVRKVLEGNHG